MVTHLLLAIGVGLIVSQLGMLCTTVYLHRTLSHRALTVRAPLAFAMRVLTWLVTGIRPRQWVAVHRKHHAFTDREGDPHSPVLLGWVRVQFGNVALYRREARNPITLARYAKDVPADRWDRVLFDHALIGLALGIGILVLLLGWWAGLVAAAFHAVFYLMTNAAVNAVGHHFGRRPYDNSATNLQWLAFISAGEGLHNNHHAAPTSARLSLHRGEVDLGWYAIRVFRLLGLARVRLEQVHLKRVPAPNAA